MDLFVTAIDTGSGKTIVSAIMARALKADYWKPVQAGVEEWDRKEIERFIGAGESRIHEEAYVLQKPASPHQSADEEGVSIKIEEIARPSTTNTLIIEGAGGVLVPLNKHNLIINIAEKFNAGVVLVCDIRLGCINHTLLTVNELNRRGVPVKGIVFNREGNPYTKDIILHYTGLPVLLEIPEETVFTPEIINNYACAFRRNYEKLYGVGAS